MTSGGARLRVLVVDDSLTVRSRIVAALERDPDLEVVGEAADGHSAVALCQRLRPDVVTMDMLLPGVDGLAATERLMELCPTPILVISAAGDGDGPVSTAAALAAGAVDVLEKPTGGVADQDWDARLVDAVKMVARIRVITHLGPRHGLPPVPREPDPITRPESGCEVLAIGASTGGPGAVAAVLSALPRRFDLPVMLVLHVNESFVLSLGQWLESVAGRPVRIAEAGTEVAASRGQVLMAPAGRHLVVRSGRVALTSDPPRQFCRPAVDELFESVAREYGPAAAGCLLTGMGRDGAEGLLAIRRAGGMTVAQDEATSVVYGMPREAALRGAAQHVLPLERIGPALSRLGAGPRQASNRRVESP